jgi:hypothetical protein
MEKDLSEYPTYTNEKYKQEEFVVYFIYGHCKD